MTIERLPLLHNLGGPPRASISWRGLGRLDSLGRPFARDIQSRIDQAAGAGTWLDFRYEIRPGQPFFGHDWNNARAVLRILHPDHHLDEEAARQALVQRVEAHCRSLGWPACLIAQPPKSQLSREDLVLADPLTAFVALSKSTGSIWLRARPPSLAPLHTPVSQGSRTDRDRHVRWCARLWFPNGLPANLIDTLRKAASTDARHS